MPYFVQDLIEERPTPVTVALEDRVQAALDKMLEYDFSQLPVINHSKPVGLITSESILRAQRNFGIGLDDLYVHHARVDASEFREDADLFELLDRLRDRYAVLIVDGERNLTGIVTNYDTAAYFRRRAEDMMLVENIESMVKDYIQAAYTSGDGIVDEERLQQAVQQKTDTMQGQRKVFQHALNHYLSLQGEGNPAIDEETLHAVLDKHYGAPTTIKTFADLTFYEYSELLLDKDTWHRYESVFKLGPASVRVLLQRVRLTRNALAHFQGGVSGLQRKHLRFCAAWLAQYQDAIAKHFGIDEQIESPLEGLGPMRDPEAAPATAATQQEDIAADDTLSIEDDSIPGESRYAALALWLQSQPPEKNLVKPRFAHIEEIIGGPLPASARIHRSWWANDSVSHAQSQQWLGVDWRVSSVSLTREVVRFTRMKERQKAYVKFFSLLFTELRAKADFVVPETSPDGTSWMTFTRIPESGASVASFVFSFTHGSRFRTELYIDTGEQATTQQIFDLLCADKEEIEAHLGEVTWELLDSKRASRLAVYHPGAITDDDATLADLRQWAVDTMITFYTIMKPLALQAIGEVMQA